MRQFLTTDLPWIIERLEANALKNEKAREILRFIGDAEGELAKLEIVHEFFQGMQTLCEQINELCDLLEERVRAEKPKKRNKNGNTKLWKNRKGIKAGVVAASRDNQAL